MSYTHRDIQREEIVRVLEKHKGKKWDCLEIGAAGGDEREQIAQFIEVKSYTMVDNFKQYQREGILTMDAHDLKFPDNSFDFVFMSHTAEHFTNPLQAIREIHRVLRPGGVVLSINPNPCYHQILNGDPDHIFVLSDLQNLKLYSFAGFKQVWSHVQNMAFGEVIEKEQNYMVVTEAIK